MRTTDTAIKPRLNKETVMQFNKTSHRRPAPADDRRRWLGCCDRMSLMSSPTQTGF